MLIVLTVALPVFGLIAVGAIVGRFALLGSGATSALNRFVMYLALPAVLFQAMARIDLRDFFDAAYFAAFGGAIVVAFALSLALSARSRTPFANATVQALAATFCNTGYVGIPLCLAAFGQASLVPAVIAMVITACLHLGVAMALIEAAVQPAQALGRTLRKVLGVLARNPFLISPMLGLIHGQLGLGLPLALDRFLTLLGAAATPCALVAIGLQLVEAGERFPVGLVARLVGIKLLVQPAVAFLIAVWLVDLPPVWIATAVIMSALPTGTSAFLLAEVYGREARSCSGTVLVSTILSFVTLSVMLSWFSERVPPP